MSDTAQDYSSHRRWVPAYHFFLSALVLATLIGSVVNVVKSAGTTGFYSATLLLAVSVALVLIFFYARSFALKAQDRVIRAEENFRCYVRTGKVLDPRLTVAQIVGLRFASDEEIDDLAERAIGESLSGDDIKKAIKNWRADDYRV
jgi:hypothetical protein